MSDYLQSFLEPLAQQNFLQRAFEEALVPSVKFLAAAPYEKMPPGSDGQVIQTVAANMDVDLDPVVPGEDAKSQSNKYEWYICKVKQWDGSTPVPMNQAALTLAGVEGFWIQKFRELAVNCGTKLNLLCRNELYKGYLQGNTMTYAATANATSVFLVSGNGFRTRVINQVEQPISVTNTRTVIIDGQQRTATGWVPLDAALPDGPGVLTVSVAVTVAINRPVRDLNCSRIIRPQGAGHIDAIGANDIATMAMFRRAAAELDNDFVPPMLDGTYHVHLSPNVCDQLRGDNEFQRMYETRGGQYMEDGSLGVIGNLRFFSNNQTPQPGDRNSPNPLDVAAATAGARTTLLSPHYYGELYNIDGVQIQRSIVIGRNAIKCRYEDESAMMIADASAPIGATVSFAKVGSTLQMMAGSDKMGQVRITVRPPIDKRGQNTDITWSTTRGWAIPSNLLSGQSNAQNKRAMVIETGFAPI